jgi:hypothetical protein
MKLPKGRLFSPLQLSAAVTLFMVPSFPYSEICPFLPVKTFPLAGPLEFAFREASSFGSR